MSLFLYVAEDADGSGLRANCTVASLIILIRDLTKSWPNYTKLP